MYLYIFKSFSVVFVYLGKKETAIVLKKYFNSIACKAGGWAGAFDFDTYCAHVCAPRPGPVFALTRGNTSRRISAAGSAPGLAVLADSVFLAVLAGRVGSNL